MLSITKPATDGTAPSSRRPFLGGSTAMSLITGMLFSMLLSVLMGCHRGNHEEPEHHHPAHRPATFEAAVDRIVELYEELREEKRRAPDQLDLIDEFRDIVRWLPTLAADSDLDEFSWNEVHAIAKQLQALLFARVPTDAAERGSWYRTHRQQNEQFQQELLRIKKIALDTQPTLSGTARAVAETM